PIIRRGIRMREKVFCSLGEGNPATAEQIDQAKKNVPDLANLTNRDAVTAITSATACISCHAKFNPAGFLFESYDQLGKFRTVESIFDSSGNVVKTYPINTRVDNTGFETLPQPAKDAMEMVQDIGQSNNARACFAMKIMTFYRVATPDIAIDNCTLNEIYKSTAAGTVLEVIATAIANEDIFWKKTGN
ncbi:MAG: DUF1588 domain-containing protein, partial [Pseudobdellovibrionaceae bacterium]